MSQPLVSVIIPTYSRPNNLVRAIESVLNQTYKNIEIIVVDDNGQGSEMQLLTYNTLAEFIAKKRIRYIVHELNQNGSVARNTGFKYSKGTFINYLDDDDIMSSNKISSQLKTLSLNEEFDACYCDTILIRDDGTKKEIYNPNYIETVGPILSGKYFLNTSTVLFRRSAIERIQGFDERFRRHQDYELYLRYFRNSKMINANPAKTFIIKYETSNVVSDNPFKAREYLEFFFKEFRKEIDLSPQKRKIYVYQYNTCLVRYIKNKKYKAAWRMYIKILEYGFPSLVMHLKYIYHLYHNYR